MKIIIQKKVEVWIEEHYDIEDESQIQDALDYNIDCFEVDTLWETQEDLGPVEVYDENWKLLYSNENEQVHQD